MTEKMKKKFIIEDSSSPAEASLPSESSPQSSSSSLTESSLPSSSSTSSSSLIPPSTSKSVSSESGMASFDLTDLNAGIYLLRSSNSVGVIKIQKY
jgi:hypothetical protein